MQRKTTLILAATALVTSGVLFYSRVYANVPGSGPPIIYSGFLQEAGANANGSRQIGLALWKLNDTQDLGNQLCSQPPAPTDVSNGWFQLQLDQSCMDALRKNSAAWLEFIVVQGSKQTHFPLFAVGAVPFAETAMRTRSMSPGARLAPRYLLGTDGSYFRSEGAFRDLTRDEVCFYQQTTENAEGGRCLPTATWILPGSVAHYSPCTGNANSVTVPDAAVAGWSGGNPNRYVVKASLEGPVESIHHAQVQVVQTCLSWDYSGSSYTCLICRDMQIVTAGQEIPLDDFVAYSETWGP